MVEEIAGDIPCSSLVVESVIRVGTAGMLWGICNGPYDANKLGLTGLSRVSFVGKTVGEFGLGCGLFAGILATTRFGIERYRRKNDWVNDLIAGAVAGAAIGARSRNWRHVAAMGALGSAICAVARRTSTD